MPSNLLARLVGSDESHLKIVPSFQRKVRVFAYILLMSGNILDEAFVHQHVIMPYKTSVSPCYGERFDFADTLNVDVSQMSNVILNIECTVVASMSKVAATPGDVRTMKRFSSLTK